MCDLLVFSSFKLKHEKNLQSYLFNIFEKLAYISTLWGVEREKGKSERSKVAAAALAVNI